MISRLENIYLYHIQRFITCEQDQQDREGGEKISHFRHLKWKKVKFKYTRALRIQFSHWKGFCFIFTRTENELIDLNLSRLDADELLSVENFKLEWSRSLWKIFCFHSAEIRIFMKEENKKPKNEDKQCFSLFKCFMTWTKFGGFFLSYCHCWIILQFYTTHITHDIVSGRIDNRNCFVFLNFIWFFLIFE